MNEVINDLNKELKNKSVLILAVSGGPDSMCLLNLILNIKKEKQLKIICAHVNHKLRKESEEEAEMVKNFCKSNKITYEYYEIIHYKGNVENYARKKRYDFFEKLIKKYNANYLLTAHHGDDLIETMIMKISRGTNNDSFKGFSKITKRNNYKILRPLIHITKEEILTYCKNNNISYAIDKTNNDDTYTRNRIRKYILPYLKNENKNIHKNFLKLSETIEKYDKHITKEVNKIFPNIYNDGKINIKLFNKEDDIIKEKITYNILEKTYKDDIYLIKDRHINSIIKINESNKPNKIINLPKNKNYIKTYNIGKIIDTQIQTEYNLILNKEIKLPNRHIIKVINNIDDNSNNVIKLNSNKIKLPLHIRTRKNGDRIKIKGLNGSKKIKDIFIDEKIPISKRKTIPIVTDDNDIIIWIPGIKKSEFDESKTENYDIIVKYF